MSLHLLEVWCSCWITIFDWKCLWMKFLLNIQTEQWADNLTLIFLTANTGNALISKSYSYTGRKRHCCRSVFQCPASLMTEDFPKTGRKSFQLRQSAIARFGRTFCCWRKNYSWFIEATDINANSCSFLSRGSCWNVVRGNVLCEHPLIFWNAILWQ